MSTSLFALLDDISAVLDDVATMTKVATKKTAGVLGDDLALNAEQVSGIQPDRELPVILAVAKGSAFNKVLLVPLALVISTWAPFLIVPLMLAGGTFLCFEGVEKLVEAWHRRRNPGQAHQVHPASGDATEAQRIRGAIRTDMILSAEIVVISLGAVGEEPFAVRALALCAVSALATVGIYGFVAGVVKLDDLGLLLSKRSGALARAVSRVLLRASPVLMRALSVIGTVAVFLVGGGIATHSVERVSRWSHHVEASLSEVDGLGQLLALLWSPLFDALVGLLLGVLAVLVFTAGRRVLSGLASARG